MFGIGKGESKAMTQFKSSYIIHGVDFSSGLSNINEKIRNEWETPDWLFDILHDVFHFTVDAAANIDNYKFSKFFDVEQDGLKQPWDSEIVFCNPPHSKGAYGAWVDKAELEFLNSGITSVLVLPFNWETGGFGGIRDTANYLVLPYKRIKYDPPDGLEGKSPTFYSCIAIFTWFRLSQEDIDKLSKIGNVLDLDNGLLTR